MWEKVIPKHKEENKQDTNPLKGKYGFELSHINSALEHTRREILLRVQGDWDVLPIHIRDYFKDVLDYERAWRDGSCRDWRSFWNQPSGGEKGEVDLSHDWWNNPYVSREPTLMGEEFSREAPLSPAETKKKLHEMMREAGLI